MNKIVGIDLGTTNSVISVLEGASPIIISNSEGLRTTPSIIAYSENNDLLVGNFAKRQNIINPQNTFSSIKRFIGCKYLEIKNEISHVSYTVEEDENGNVKIYCPNLKKYFHPEEISALILKKLVEDATKFLKEPVKEAVITVPAYFNDSQRVATKDAGIIAGLNVLRILNEPTAAALAYGLNKKKNEIILIFDLGGGTFDVSILEVGDEVFEVLSTSGDTHLGGDDFDHVIVNYIIDDFLKKEGINLLNDKQALQRIIEAAERAKIELSNMQLTHVNIPFIYIDYKTRIPKNIDIILTRSKFEELSISLLEKCKSPILLALNDANLSKNKIDEIILVGGSTRIPAVKNLLKNIFEKDLNETVNPDEVVAMGAAIQAGILGGEIKDLILLDVTPLSLGVETLGEIMTTIIPRNTSVPVKKSETFSTSSDYQDSVEIHVLQGERTFVKDNKSLGTFVLNGIPKELKGVPEILVTFQLDVDGLLTISAKENKSGIEQSIKIEGASNISRDEVKKILDDSEKNSKIDIFKKIIFILSYELDLLQFKLEKELFVFEKFNLNSSLLSNFLKRLYIKNNILNFIKFKKN
jgi:molecular chaperone DnaK